jgi:hypothetical protein
MNYRNMRRPRGNPGLDGLPVVAPPTGTMYVAWAAGRDKKVSKSPVNLRGMIDGDVSMVGVQEQRDSTSDAQWC